MIFARTNEMNEILRLLFVNIDYWYLIYDNMSLKCCDLIV